MKENTKVTNADEENQEKQADQNSEIQHSKSETDKTRVAIGISVGIATTSLLVLIAVTIYTLKQRRKMDSFNYRRKLASQNCSSNNSQFTLIPTFVTSQGRNTMTSQRNTTGSSPERERTISTASDARGFPVSEVRDPAEFDFYDCANNSKTLDGYYGNDGIIVHV